MRGRCMPPWVTSYQSVTALHFQNVSAISYIEVGIVGDEDHLVAGDRMCNSPIGDIRLGRFSCLAEAHPADDGADSFGSF